MDNPNGAAIGREPHLPLTIGTNAESPAADLVHRAVLLDRRPEAGVRKRFFEGGHHLHAAGSYPTRAHTDPYRYVFVHECSGASREGKMIISKCKMLN